MQWYQDIYLQTYVAAAAILVGAIFLRRLLLVYWVVWVILWANVFVDIYTTYLAFNDINTLIYNNLLFVSEEFVIIFLYVKETPSKKLQQLFTLFIITLLGFAVINFLFIQGPNDFNTYSAMPLGLIISVLSYLNIRRFILTDAFVKKLLFWFSVANFIYFIVIIPSLSFIPLANSISYELGASLKVINDTAYILWSVLISIGFICQEK